MKQIVINIGPEGYRLRVFGDVSNTEVLGMLHRAKIIVESDLAEEDVEYHRLRRKVWTDTLICEEEVLP